MALSKRDDAIALRSHSFSTSTETLLPYFSKNGLTVHKIDYDYYPEACKTARVWSKIAAQKSKELPYLSEEWERFSDCSAANSGIAWCLENPAQYDQIYVCEDTKKEPQGMVVLKIEDDKIYVAYLATHPKNIRSSINQEDPERVEGAGSAMLEWAQKLTYHLNKEQIYLYTSNSAKPFFLKMGFMEGKSQMPNYMSKTFHYQ